MYYAFFRVLVHNVELLVDPGNRVVRTAARLQMLAAPSNRLLSHVHGFLVGS